jgi:GT2 family glycosyltransferase
VLDHCAGEISKVLIMDDASGEDPPSFPTEVEVRRHEENEGFPATLNDGIAALDADVIVHFDADGHPIMNFAPPVREAFGGSEELGALGFQLVDNEGKPTGSYKIESNISGWRFVLGQRVSKKLCADYTSGLLLPNACGTAVRREAFESVGGFDESFELLDVDLDFFLRLDRAGWKVGFDPNIQAYHEGGGTPQSTATRVMRHHRDRWRFLRKHGYVNHPNVYKWLLFARHGVEYGLLSTFGRQLFPDPERLRDKLKSRRALIRKVYRGYD